MKPFSVQGLAFVLLAAAVAHAQGTATNEAGTGTTAVSGPVTQTGVTTRPPLPTTGASAGSGTPPVA
ncbi:hypothetical protein IWW57_005457, partial [Coemansia sp. S610]